MDKNLVTLEFDKILSLLSNEAGVNDAKDLALSLRPSKNLESAQTLLTQTDNAYVLIAKFGAPSFYGMENITNSLRRAAAGASLTLGELIKISKTVRSLRILLEWREKSQSIKTVMDHHFESISSNKFLEQSIDNAIISEEELSDNASPALSSIRRKIRNAGEKIKSQLDKMIRSSTYQKYLQENIVTQRDGRYVVPVKAEHKNEVQGLVHDSSSSGATLFIEPMSVVQANNEIKILKSQELDEIERIIMELSSLAGSFADGIIDGYDSAVQINLIFAKAQLAYKMKATMPILNDKGQINLKNARHPLIDPKTVVPTNIEIGYGFNSLIVTGPNTGGKTVSLKTTGLLCLMAMSGLMLPVSENSHISHFKNVLADIGDEQSIEQSLSTFSSHMTNIISILKRCDDNSLVLIDELGSGTDPVEGAALAMAIIEAMRQKGVKLMATTHYAELKEYALKTAGVENACCEFDVSTLSPTYKLLIGIPGKSNAFAISQKLGMNLNIIERAKELVSKESSEFESVMQKLEASRQETEKKLKLANEQMQIARSEAAKAKKISEEVEKKADKEIEDAKSRASLIVSRTRAQAEDLIRELELIKKMGNKALSAQQKAMLKSGIKNLENSSDPIEKKDTGEYVLPRPLKIGDDVKIFDIDKAATVLEINGDNILVQAGIIKTRVDIKNLRLIENKKKEKSKASSGHRTVTKKLVEQSASLSVDLRGMDSYEAIMEVEDFIDRAVRQNISQITIIHGKGTGVLRNAVQAHLRKNSSVRSYRLGVFGEGESGVTIAELK